MYVLYDYSLNQFLEGVLTDDDGRQHARGTYRKALAMRFDSLHAAGKFREHYEAFRCGIARFRDIVGV